MLGANGQVSVRLCVHLCECVSVGLGVGGVGGEGRGEGTSTAGPPGGSTAGMHCAPQIASPRGTG